MDELRADITELQKLNEITTRQHVKDILSIEIRKLQTEIIRRSEDTDKTSLKSNTCEVTARKSEKITTTPSGRYTKTLTNYAWDQSDKFMKIYVSLEGVHTVEKSNVKSEFTKSSFRLDIQDLDGADHRLSVVNLFQNIDTESSYHKIKTDMVLVMLKKAEQKTWAYVTQQERKAKEKTPKIDENKDPNESLMDMLKSMYEEGDDEMKQTIARAWSQSRDNSVTEDL